MHLLSSLHIALYYMILVHDSSSQYHFFILILQFLFILHTLTWARMSSFSYSHPAKRLLLKKKLFKWAEFGKGVKQNQASILVWVNICMCSMKTFGFLVLCLVMGITAFVSFTCLSTGGTSPSPGMAFKWWQTDDMTMIIRSRKLQGNGYGPSTAEYVSSKNINLEDYRPIDPVPSAKASIRPSPIEHGTPLMPYIPKPSPPPISSKNGLP